MLLDKNKIKEKYHKYSFEIKSIIISLIILFSISPIVTFFQNLNAYDVEIKGTIVEIDSKYTGGGRYIIANDKNCIAISGDNINSKKKYYLINDEVNITVKNYKIVWMGKDYESYKQVQNKSR